MAQEIYDVMRRMQKRAADSAAVNQSTDGATVTNAKVNPVKIYECPDAIRIGDFGHLFARVRFWRGRPFVDIRRYRPDQARPNFYHPDNGSVFLSQRQFESLVSKAESISNLLSQYGGNAPSDEDCPSGSDAAGCDESTKPKLMPQNATTEGEDMTGAATADFLQAFAKELDQKSQC
jgi:hypothetical protein